MSETRDRTMDRYDEKAREMTTRVLRLIGWQPATPEEQERILTHVDHVNREYLRTAVAEEREACAFMADEHYRGNAEDDWAVGWNNACEHIAQAIRSRSDD